MSPTGILLPAGLRIKENKEVYEGEVTEMTPEETEAPGGGFQKAISHVVIGLRTVRHHRETKVVYTVGRSQSARWNWRSLPDSHLARRHRAAHSEVLIGRCIHRVEGRNSS